MSDVTNPLIVQSDLTVLLEVAAGRADDARAALARFAELEKAPEHVHTYRLTPLSLWNAAVVGETAESIIDVLTSFAKYPVAETVLREIDDLVGRYGRVWLARVPDGLVLVSDDADLLDQLGGQRTLSDVLDRRLDRHRYLVREADRGVVKQALLTAGWPASDEAGFDAGLPLVRDGAGADVEPTGGLVRVTLRDYQHDAIAAWWRDGDASGGSGVIVLPCGAGKTVVGLGAIAAANTRALIVCTSVTSVRQWIRELLDKTTLTADDVGEWSGHLKQLRPITCVTYQSLTWRDPEVPHDADLFEQHPHLALFNELGWGLVIYDEVHLLPAPVFRAAARVQSMRRLGLTATLVREDGREPDIFSLIGPKRYDAPWSSVEASGWIAAASCVEVRVPLGADTRARYSQAEPKLRHQIAATATEKVEVVERLVARHPDEQILVIGQFVEQLEELAGRLDAPLLTGRTGVRAREAMFARFRAGEVRVLVVSKIANFSIDLPEVSVAVQVSGQFGSRQEEAQRLGRLLRPKRGGGGATFYTVVADGTEEVRFARNRQRFLAEQGYAYTIIDAPELP